MEAAQAFQIQEANHDDLDPKNQVASAHTIGKDSWLQMAFVLVTSVSSAFILGYPKLIMAYLGWTSGMIGLLLGGAASLYANCLLASLHYVDGKRLIRYRDLAGHIYGKKMYIVTWILQYSNLFTINTGFIILAGQALKGVHRTLDPSYHGSMRLPLWILIVGCVCFLFAIFIPHLSDIQRWIIVSTVFTIVYVLVVLIGSIQDGVHSQPRDYSVHETKSSRAFNTIAAVANIAFSYNTGILPELQATLRDPAVKNMKKALYLQFTLGSAILYVIIAVGYWAYGSNVSAYLLNDVHAAKPVLVLANLAVFFQTVISLHIFAMPLYEFCDTKFAKINGSQFMVRLMARGLYILINTFVAACLPFLGDFMNLTGGLSTFPLTFVLSHHIYLMVKRNEMSRARRLWHWLNVAIFSIMSIASCVSAVRLIVIDSRSYHLFADL